MNCFKWAAVAAVGLVMVAGSLAKAGDFDDCQFAWGAKSVKPPHPLFSYAVVETGEHEVGFELEFASLDDTAHQLQGTLYICEWDDVNKVEGEQVGGQFWSHTAPGNQTTTKDVFETVDLSVGWYIFYIDDCTARDVGDPNWLNVDGVGPCWIKVEDSGYSEEEP